MNCTQARRMLFESDRPDHPTGDVAGHLIDCPACQAAQRRLTLLERNLARLPVPASAPPAALLERVLNAPALVSRPAHLRPATDPRALARQKLALSLALAASLAVFTLGWWAWPHQTSVDGSSDRVYTTAVNHVLAQGPEQGAEGLAGLAEMWFAAAELSDPEKMGTLARRFNRLMRQDLPSQVAQLSPGERPRVLESLTTRLAKLEGDIDRLAAGRANLGGPAAASLVRIGDAVRDAHWKLKRLTRERA